MFPEEQQQLGRYRLIKLIATGGMGAIYLAEDVSINRQVAIKVIRSETMPYSTDGGPSDAARLFEREAKAIAMLDHPHILPLYDYGEEKKDGTTLTYLVMPYRPEGSLATWLEQRGATNPLALEDVENIITQTASALQYTHDHHIIHQDVKPSNFLIRTNKDNPNRPDILISDFGIARLSNMTTDASQSIRGTPGYMSPEQWAGNPLPASDQYALAVMAYELVTGRPPFKGNPMQMMFAHVNTTPQTPSSITPGLPPALDTVILRGLSKEPADRFPSIAAFAQAFQQAVHGTFASPVQLSNPYAPAQIGASGANTTSNPDLYATLAISEAEALNGSDRTLTLPDGKQIPVSIPAGARNGQVLELNNTITTAAGVTTNIVRLKLSVQSIPPRNSTPLRTQQRSLPDNDAMTYFSGSTGNSSNPSLAGTNNQAVDTRWQSGAMPVAPIPGAAAYGQINGQSNAPGNWQNVGTPSQTMSPYAPATPMYTGVAPAPTGSMSPSFPGLPPQRPPQRTSRGLLITLIIVAFLLILSGGVLVYAINGGIGIGSGNGGTPGATTTTDPTNLYATQTALANAGLNAQSTATAQANASATADAQSTATAQANASATAQANATGTAYATNPYGGTLALNDPMADNSQGHNWDVANDATTGTSCQFTNGAYHMTMPGNYVGACFGEATNVSNFAFQAQMEFFKAGQHFSGGGLVFRGSGGGTGSQYYILEIYESGQYQFSACDGNDCTHAIAGYPKPSLVSSFHTGLNQANTIAVVAQDNNFTFYANGQKFAGPISDDTYNSGTIGFFAGGGSDTTPGSTTDVAYSNVKVWQL